MQHEPILNAMQGTLGFYLPRPMSTAEFRERFSLWLDEAHAPAGLSQEQAGMLFNHAADGRPLPALSPYRFGVEGQWGLLHSIGEASTDVLRRVAQEAVSGTRLPATLAAPRWEDRNVGLVRQARPVSYIVQDLIVCQRARQYKRWSSSKTEEKRAHLQDLLNTGLQRQGALLQMPVEFAEPVVTGFGCERSLPKLRHSEANVFVRLATVEFTVPATLHGHWAVGALINRGFGVIAKAGEV